VGGVSHLGTDQPVAEVCQVSHLGTDQPVAEVCQELVKADLFCSITQRISVKWLSRPWKSRRMNLRKEWIYG